MPPSEDQTAGGDSCTGALLGAGNFQSYPSPETGAPSVSVSVLYSGDWEAPGPDIVLTILVRCVNLVEVNCPGALCDAPRQVEQDASG